MSSESKATTKTQDGAGRPGRRGILFVVSSPSGGGKGTLIRSLLEALPDLRYSVSFTTRPPRAGESNGREYFFTTIAEFEAMVQHDEFLEWARVHGNLYGTSRKQVTDELNAGHDIVLEVDVQGAASVRQFVGDAVSVFILPPSLSVLRRRLADRGTDSHGELEVRLRNAPSELQHYTAFDYVIVNDDRVTAARQLIAIVEAERTRRERQAQAIAKVVDSFVDQ